MNKSILSALFLTAPLFLNSCGQAPEKASDSYVESETPETFQIADSDIKVTIKDYREESSSMRMEAMEILSRAKEINCAEAEKFAERVLVASKKSEASSNLLRVEHYIEEASQALADAEDALIYCEEKSEISYAPQLSE